jgi:hypothetical protein
MGIAFFFLMLLDSHIEKKVAIYSPLGNPRWHKRVQYYIFKIRYLQLVNKRITKIPNVKVRQLTQNKYFNEYEVYNTKSS